MIRAKSLDQEKVGGRLAAHSEAWNRVTRDNFRVGLSAGAPDTIQPQASAGPSNGEMRSSSTEGSTTGDESSDSDTVEGREYRGSTKQQGLLYIPIPDTQEEWQEQIHYEPQAFESVHKMHQIQDDDPETDQRVSQERAMGRPDGYQIGVLPHSNASQAQVFPAFLIQGEGLQFKTLPFGLSTAPKTFTRCTRPILLYCRKLGIMLFLYPDDTLVLGNTYDQAKTNGRIVAKLLLDLGFILSLEKCNFEPTQVFTHLGVTWNTKTMMLSLPQEKVQAMQKQAQHVLRYPTCRAVQRLLGLTNFASIALPLARLQSRLLQWWLKQHYKGPSDMFKTMPIMEEARHNLEWWRSFKSHPKSIHRPSVQAVIMTDASTKGFGGECNRLAFQGEWPGSKGRDMHINLLELETV